MRDRVARRVHAVIKFLNRRLFRPAAQVPDIRAEFVLSTRWEPLFSERDVALVETVAHEIEPRLAVVHRSQSLCDRLDAVLDGLVRRTRALAELALERRAVLCVVIGNDRDRLGLVFRELENALGVILDEPARHVDFAVPDQGAVRRDRPRLPDKRMHEPKVNCPDARPFLRNREPVDNMKLCVPFLVDLSLSRGPYAVE